MIKADLHVHTEMSDSSFTIEQVLKLAKEKGLTHIAITNHDTVKGLKEQNDDLTYQISRMNNEKEQIEKNILKEKKLVLSQ